MRKARVKRYQTGGKVDDDDPPLIADNTNLSSNSTPPPLLRRPTAAPVAPTRTAAPITRPAPAITTKNPFSGPPTPTGAVGSNRAVPSSVLARAPVGYDVNTNTAQLVKQTPGSISPPNTPEGRAGVGSGAAAPDVTAKYMAENSTVQNGLRTTTLPSGGTATTKARPLEPTQPNAQANLAGLPRKGPVGFVYGGRVDMTPPGNVGLKRPGPFRSGGRVRRYRFGGKISPSGGRVKKMQNGGSIFSPEHEDQGASMSDQKTAGQIPLSPTDLASRQVERNQSNELARALAMNERPVMRSGGKVRKMQNGGKVGDWNPLNPRFNYDTGKYELGPRPTPTPTPTPKKMQDGGRVALNDMLNESPETSFLGRTRPSPTPTPTPGPRFIDKVKGVAKAVADRELGFQDGGRVPPPKPTPRPSSPRPSGAPTPYPALDEVPEPKDEMSTLSKVGPSSARPLPRAYPYPRAGNFAANGKMGTFQDGGMVSGIARNTPGETQVQQTIHAPARHQFRMGGRIYERGGKIPGKPTGKDTVPTMLSPGEVVLNPKQQKRVVVRPNWQKGLNPKEKSAMSSMRLPRARNQRAVGNTVPRIFGGK